MNPQRNIAHGKHKKRSHSGDKAKGTDNKKAKVDSDRMSQETGDNPSTQKESNDVEGVEGVGAYIQNMDTAMDNNALLEAVSTMMSTKLDAVMTQMNFDMKTLFEKQMDQMRVAIEQSLTATLTHEIEKIKTTFSEDIDKLTARITVIENRPVPTFANKASIASVERNIVLRGVSESPNENVKDKVHSIITDGCKLNNIVIEKAERKTTKSNNKPGVIVATLENIEQKNRILEHKKRLHAQDNAHRHVFIHEDIDYQQRVNGYNMRTFIKAMNLENDLTVVGNKVVKKTARRTGQVADGRAVNE